MSRILYEVHAHILDPRVAEPWSAWIMKEHIAEVIEAGAISGRLIRNDDDPLKFYVQYAFADRSALDKYLAEQAPRLREEGARRFGPEQVAYTRRTGSILTPD